MQTELRKAIRLSKLSSRAIGKAVGVSHSTISRFRAGGDMTLATAEKVAELFGLSLQERNARKR